MTDDIKTVAEFFEAHFEPEILAERKRDIRTAHRRAVERFRTFLAREPVLTDLDADTCNGFEGWLSEHGFAAGGAGGYNAYRCIVKIWRHAYHVGAVDEGPVLSRRKAARPNTKFLTTPIARPGVVPTYLIEYAREYAIERGLAVDSASHLRYVINSFGKYLTRRPKLADLRDEVINQWIIERQTDGLSPETVRTQRIVLVGLWRAAVIAGYIEAPPLRLRKVKVPQRLPTAWAQEQLQKLLDSAAKTTGRFLVSGVRRPAFWRAWILVGYYSGLRRSDMLAIQFENIRPDGKLFVIQHKTGNVVRCQLPPDALEAIQATTPPLRRRIFGDALSNARLRKEFKSIVTAAKLKGSTKRLRATGATWCEVDTPGSAMNFLGHRTPGLAYKSYVDPRFLTESKPTPRSIGKIG